MYTTDTLLKDCVGHFIEKRRYSIDRSSLLNERQYCEIWTCLLQWTERQIAHKNSFVIPHFGLIEYSQSTYSYKLYIQDSYLTSSGATLANASHIDVISDDALFMSSAIKCHTSSLEKYASTMTGPQIQIGLKHIFTKLCSQIALFCSSAVNSRGNSKPRYAAHPKKIILNFGWAYLSCSDGVVDFIFSIGESPIMAAAIPTGLQHIPQQYLQSTASLISVASIPPNLPVPTTKKSAAEQEDEEEEIAALKKDLERLQQMHKLPVDEECENPLMSAASRPLVHSTSRDASAAQYATPRIFSEFSRTLGSPYGGHTNYESPSAKIGLFFTPTAALYGINSDTKRIEYTDYLPFFQASPERYYAKNARKLLQYELKYKSEHACKTTSAQLEVTALDLEIASSCKRYQQYIEHRMPDDFIPAIPQQCITNILNQLEPDLTKLAQPQIEAILQQNLAVVQTQYRVAVKQSILDYILRNFHERQRLKIAIPPHHLSEYGHSTPPCSAPLSWRNRFQQARAAIQTSCYFADQTVVQVLTLWQQYKEYRLFGVPSSQSESEESDTLMTMQITNEAVADIEAVSCSSSSACLPSAKPAEVKGPISVMPMTLLQFREAQTQHFEFVRNVLLNHWYNDCVAIMKRYVEENGAEQVADVLETNREQNLFTSIAALMARQLTEIVYASLNDCVAFFERYLNTAIAVAQTKTNVFEIENVCSSSSSSASQPLWKIALTFARNNIEFEIPLSEVSLCVTDMIDEMVTCFDGLQCVEGKLFGLLENVENIRVFIDDAFVQNVRDRILKVTDTFASNLRGLQHAYQTQFQPLFVANDELAENVSELQKVEIAQDRERKTDLLAEFKSTIAKYESLRGEIKDKAATRLTLGLVEVECHTLNVLLMSHISDLQRALPSHIAKTLVRKAQSLVSSIEDGSKQLLQKPENAQALADLQAYVQRFDDTGFGKWRRISCDIAQELEFLFETDYALSHELLRSVGRVHEWMQNKIASHRAMADENLTTQRQVIESGITSRSVQFEQKVKKMNQQVEDLQLLSEIRDTSKIEQLQQDMRVVETDIQYVIQQQQLLEMDKSDLTMLKSLQNRIAKL